MNDFLAIDLQIPLNNLIHEIIRLVLGQLLLHFHVQITRTQLSYDVSVILGCVYFMESEDVGDILYLLEDFDL